MTMLEFMCTLAMLNISIVSFIWSMKQIILMSYWFYKREMERINKNE